MASPIPDASDRCKPKHPNRKVRIVGKIRALGVEETGSLGQDLNPWINVRKPQEGDTSEKVKISFVDQSTRCKDATFELDYCYGQNEDTGLIFSREIKPMISNVFYGLNESVIAYGARGSGKTYTMLGSLEKPGLVEMTVAEILSKADETRKTISVSFYEVFQDRVYDLLDSEHHEVQVLEDARGKVKLKGLSQVPVKSTSEFHNLCLSSFTCHKPVQKIPYETPRRKHKGLTVHVCSVDNDMNSNLVGKMNFVDLAGYEDARRNSRDGNTFVENTRINKSLYALINVVYALNANEIHVPYRESKLTRMLQESLGGQNHALLLTFLNPTFCQDTIYAITLASRSCQTATQFITSSTKNNKSSTKLEGKPSVKIGKSVTTLFKAKKQTGSMMHFPMKKDNGVLRGRKLFDELKTVTAEQVKIPLDNAAVPNNKLLAVYDTTPSLQREALQEKSISDCSPPLVAQKDEAVSPNAINGVPSIAQTESEVSVTTGVNRDNNSSTDGAGAEKENDFLLINQGRSPPLSERLRELSNNLKSLCCSSPLIPEELEPLYGDQVGCTDIIEPKTPVVQHDVPFNNNIEITKYSSPWETFSKRSSGMKNSIVQEYLKFLNTANKEELKGLKGIGDKRATYILELREESPEPFKRLEDLQDIGLSAKQVKGMMRKMAVELFT